MVGVMIAAGKLAGDGPAVTGALQAGILAAFVVCGAAVFLLIKSKDRRFYAGLPLVLIGALLVGGMLGGVGAYDSVSTEYEELLAAPVPPAVYQAEAAAEQARRESERRERRERQERERRERERREREEQQAKDDEEDEQEETREPEKEDPRALPGGAEAVVMLEAESVEDAGVWGRERSREASGRRYLQWHGPEKSMARPPEENRLRYEFDVPEDGRYEVYVEALTASASEDSFWVTFEEFDRERSRHIPPDNGWVLIWAGIAEEWTWVPVAHQDSGNAEPAQFYLKKGKQTLLVGWREVGVKLDRLALVRAEQ
jgi:hypothetical protein